MAAAGIIHRSRFGHSSCASARHRANLRNTGNRESPVASTSPWPIALWPFPGAAAQSKTPGGKGIRAKFILDKEPPDTHPSDCPPDTPEVRGGAPSVTPPTLDPPSTHKGTLTP